jgi:hypothetical protein
MRVLNAIVLTALCIAGASAASAADLPVGRSAYYSPGGFVEGQRISPLVVYSSEPGVVVRAYWRTPWHNHHYFPWTGRKPQIGRDEDLSAPSDPSEPPATFKRSWSNASAYQPASPRRRAPAKARSPQLDPSLPPLK